MTEIEAFEAWCFANSLHYLNFRLIKYPDEGRYADSRIEGAYKIWKAACEWKENHDGG